MAQALADAHAEKAIADHRARLPAAGGPGAVLCEACGEPIAAARRQALPGVVRCVACQEVLEGLRR